jgi:RNA recognition motif-containing protein
MSSEKPIIEERIYIGNVDFKATEEDLTKLFEGLNVYVV